MSRGGRDSAPIGFRILMMAFPRGFRARHGRDLLELYRDYGAAGRAASRIGAAWDLLRNGFGVRGDDFRSAGAPRTQRLPTKRTTAMDSIWQDITFGARMLRKSPAFTAVAVLSLAIGIGANTVVFGFVDASLLRSLAVTNPHELVVLGWRTRAGTEMPDVSTWGWYLRDDNGDGLSSSYSLPAFEAIRDRNEVLSSTFAFADAGRINVIVDNQAEHASGQYVSGNYYTALGVDPALGRLIVADDDRAAAGSVAVLSHGYWSRRFGESADVVGGTIRINNAPFTVIGVAPADFHGTLQVGDDPDVTVPLAHQSLVSTSSRDMTRPVFWWLHLMGRMRDGVTMAAAESHLNAL